MYNKDPKAKKNSKTVHVDWDSGKQDSMNSGAEGLTIDFKH